MSTKISELPSLSGAIPSSNDSPISVSGNTYRFTVGDLAAVSSAGNSSLSTPLIKLSGTWISGGTTTTTKPHVLVEVAGATSTSWSTSGTALGINSSSGFIGNLLDLKKDGTTGMSVNYQGQISLNVNGSVGNVSGTVALLEFYNGLRFGNQSGVGISWSNNVSPNASVDTGLYRDSAGSLGQRSGTTNQCSSLYGTYTSSTNYERVKICYNSSTSTFQIGTEKGSGGGTARALDLITDGTVRLTLGATGVLKSSLAGGGSSTIRTSSDWGIGPSHLGTGMVIGDIVSCGMWFRSATSVSISDFTVFGWADGGGWSGSLNTALSKISVGVVGVGNGTAGDFSGFIQDLYRRKGSGSPEGVVTAPVGATYHRTDGGAGTSFYVKESGSGNTGWVAK